MAKQLYSADHALLTVRIPKALRKAARIHCVEKNTTLMELIAQAIAEKLKRAGK